MTGPPGFTERPLREYVVAYLPPLRSQPAATGVDRSLRGWLRRVVLPKVVAAVAAAVIIWIILQTVDLIAPRPIFCPHKRPTGEIVESVCMIDFWPYGD